VQEVVRFLAEERLITQKDGRWKPAKDTQLEMNIPEGLRDVIGKRLSLISKPCNQLLSIASVIGRDFHLDVLKKVAGFSDDELFKAIEEARKAAIIEERSSLGANVAYRFAHAFFRQTLYEEMIAPKRIRLHQQVARALEEIYAKKIEDHAAELAEHFSHSSDADDLKKAVGYGEMAAKKALVVYAYGEAIRLLEQTLKVQEILDPEDKAKRCDLLLDLCDILIIIPDTRRIIETEAPTAFSLAESIGDNTRTVRACLAAIFSLTMEQLDVSTPAATTWTERIDHYAKPETVERVFADTAVGSRKCSVGEKETGLALVNKAVETAHRLGNPNTVTYAVSTLMFWLRDTNQLPQREQLCEELWANRQHGSFMYNLTVYWYLASTSLSLGHRKRAEEVCVELQRKTERTGDFFTELLYTAVQATLATIDGNFEFAIEITNKLRMRGKELGVPLITSAFVSSGIQAQLYLGTSLEELPNKVHETGPEVIPLSCLVNALLGKAGEALKAINEFLNNRRSTALYDLNGFWVSTLLFEASLEIGDLPTVEILLKYISGTNICTPDFYPTCIPRHLGRAAVLQGKYDEAKKHYLEAIKVCMDMRFRPELALSRLQLAELLLEHFPPEKKEALEHLDFAIKEFREMKMQPSLERALRHKDILKA
jgi:tetratricopeptide (TPR) repeat protein